MEALSFSLFVAGIAASVLIGFDTLWALLFGVLCFGGYALAKGCRPSDVLRAMGKSVFSLWKLLCMFFLIGAVTALWRQCGTISWIVTTTVSVIAPRLFLLFSFLLSVLMTMLVGSSLCTCCTMGLVLVLMGHSAGVSELLTGGAVMSGALVGDRCSPMSTCAHLLCTVTGCDFYVYFRRVLRSGAVPLLMTALVYVLIPVGGDMSEAAAMGAGIGQGFRMHWTLLLPALVILVLCICRVNIYLTMGASFAAAFLLGVFLQGCTPLYLLHTAVFGFVPAAEQSSLLGGGGALSMQRVVSIIGLSSAYMGIFRITALKAWLERPFDALSERLGKESSVLLLSIPVAMFGCSQSMSAMLMGELCGHCAKEPEEAALMLADTIVVTAALIPWNTLNAALCTAMGIGSRTVLFAAYVFLLPGINVLWHIIKKKKVPVFR